MTEDKAREYLRKMLRSFTAGSIFHLLARLSVEAAKEAQRDGNTWRYQQLMLVEAGLIVAGYGVEAACPEKTLCKPSTF